MIRFRDAATLALTKLRTRRIRTTITIVISGLLFSSLIAALITAQGAVQSVDKFNAIGLGNRYVVQALNEQSFIADIFQNQSVMARATDLYNQTIAAKKAAAKKLGIDYDPSTEQKPVQADNTPGGSITFLNAETPAAEQAIAEYFQAHPLAGLATLESGAQKYHPKAFYTSTIASPTNGTLTTMTDGVEDFSADQQASTKAQSSDPLTKNPLTFMPDALSRPFVLPHVSPSNDPNAIPIIAPYSVATQLLGLSSLPGSATPAQKLARIKELYAKAGSLSFAACYRNSVSEQQIQSAISTAAQIAANKGNKDYHKPPLIYGLPAADSCSQAPVISDTRTADQKKQDANQDTFNAEFGQTVTPDQQKITFHVVGLVPDGPTGAPSNSAAGIIQSLVGSSLAGVLAVPQGMYDALPTLARYNQLFTSKQQDIFAPTATYYAEFYSATDARSFINDKSCSGNASDICIKAGKPFILSAFGSDSIALQDLQHKFSRAFELAALAVVAIAVVIMTGTIGRMIADGRRETAVFRAVGAERIDVATMYLLYTLALSLLVAGFAVGAGVLIAYGVDHYLWQRATVYAQLAYGGNDTALGFRFFAFHAVVWLVAAAAVAAGLVSAILPLLRNVRRNPIKDMRDE